MIPIGVVPTPTAGQAEFIAMRLASAVGFAVAPVSLKPGRKPAEEFFQGRRWSNRACRSRAWSSVLPQRTLNTSRNAAIALTNLRRFSLVRISSELAP